MSAQTNGRWVTFRAAAAGVAIAFTAACGGEQRSDAADGGAAVASGGADTATAVSPTDTVAALLPDTTITLPAVKDSSSAAPKPAAKPTPKPEPKPQTQPAAAPRDTQSATPPAAAAAQEPPAPAQDTAPAAPSPQAAAPAGDAPLRDEYHQAPRDTVVQAVYDGWKQYNLNCARCHGEDVMGTTIAPHLVVSLKPDGPINTKESFVQVVCAGRPDRGMPAWCPLGLEMEKIEQIYSYVKGRSDNEIGPGRPAVKQGG